MNYIASTNNIHIEDSAFVPKYDFGFILTHIFKESENSGNHSLVWNRSFHSLKMEWATHNLCYALHLWRSHTKDVDLNYPQKWYTALFYEVAGLIAWLFIK